MAYKNLDDYAEQLLNAELERLDELEVMESMQGGSIYLVTMETEDGEGYEEYCASLEEVNFLEDECAAREMYFKVERLEY